MESFYEKQAFDLVSKAIESALRAVELEKRHNLVCINCPTKNKVSFEELAISKLEEANRVFFIAQTNISANYNDEAEISTANIAWSSCKDFNEKVGLKEIEAFVQTWKRDNAWLHCIDFLGEEEHDYDRRFKYRVRWSIPTRRKPIPRATACVYFTIHVSKIKPDTLPVEVYYVFEGNRLVHRPGKSRFREIWLKDIIESKILSMAEVTF